MSCRLLVNTATELKEVALQDKEGVWHIASWQGQKIDVDRLVPSIEELLSKSGLDYTDLEEILVVKGPGSFTSLRLGISVVNTLARELKIPIYTIGTAAYLQARTGLSDALVLLKAGGKQVHVFRGSSYEGLSAISEVEVAADEPIVVDFTDKLKGLWVEADGPKLIEIDKWQELGEVWESIQDTFAEQAWPLLPDYCKPPAITM